MIYQTQSGGEKRGERRRAKNPFTSLPAPIPSKIADTTQIPSEIKTAEVIDIRASQVFYRTFSISQGAKNVFRL